MLKRTLLSLPVLCACFSMDATAASYHKGDVSIKPLSLNFTNLTIGRGNSDSILDNTEHDAFKESEIGFGLNGLDRNGITYGFEVGYLVTDNVEVFGTVDLAYERGNHFGLSATRTFHYDSRFTPGVSLGARKYFPKSGKKWVPYIGASAGVTYQDKTEADLMIDADPSPLADVFSDAGSYTLQDNQTLFEGEFQLGLDYRFDERWALSFKTGVHYGERGDSQTTAILGQSHTYTDNRDEVTIPFVVSLKIVL